MDYFETAQSLISQGIRVLCAASQGDVDCANTCNAVEQQTGYQKIIYPGNAHGVYMIDPNLEPVLLEEFITLLQEELIE